MGFICPAKAEVIIAAVAPLSGKYAYFGKQIKAGSEMAVKNINKAGGVLGKKLTLITADDLCSQKKAKSIALLFAKRKAGAEDEKVSMVVGHYCSNAISKASDIYNRAGILHISPVITDNTTCANGEEDENHINLQSNSASEFIVRNYKDKKIAVLYADNTQGSSLARETKQSLNDKGVKEAVFAAYTSGQRDYQALAKTLEDSEIEVVFFGGNAEDAGLLLSQIKKDMVFISGSDIIRPEFLEKAGTSANKSIFTFVKEQRDNPASAPVVTDFRLAGVEPEGYTLYAYAAVEAWAKAVNEAESTDVDKVKKILQKNNIDTVIGKTGLNNADGIGNNRYVIYRWNDGKYEQVN